MYPRNFFANPQARLRSGKCFVIMPFAPAFDEIYDTIRRALEGSGSFTCARADDLQRGGHILEDVFREIAESEIVIADLTGRNPNVFYELGIVQMVKSVEKVILLSQDADSIPFDVREFRCIIYTPSSQGAGELTDKLISYVKAGADTSFRFRLARKGSYQFPHKLMGPDRCAYDFAIRGPMFVVNGVKVELCVTRHVLGRPPEAVFDGTCSLNLDQRIQLDGLEWDLQLESTAGDLAQFVVQRRV